MTIEQEKNRRIGSNMKKLIAVLMAMLLSGCAINSGVIQSEQDTFMITRQASTGFEGSFRIKNLALYDAKQFCANQGKCMHVVSIGGHNPPYILGNFPRVELKFMCLDAEDPRLTSEELGTMQRPFQNETTTNTLESKLKTLNKLLTDGLITNTEFEEQKKKLLNDFSSNRN